MLACLCALLLLRGGHHAPAVVVDLAVLVTIWLCWSQSGCAGLAGIFLHEMLYGKTPFRGRNRQRTFTNVLMKELTFPDTVQVQPPSCGLAAVPALSARSAPSALGLPDLLVGPDAWCNCPCPGVLMCGATAGAPL